MQNAKMDEKIRLKATKKDKRRIREVNTIIFNFKQFRI